MMRVSAAALTTRIGTTVSLYTTSAATTRLQPSSSRGTACGTGRFSRQGTARDPLGVFHGGLHELKALVTPALVAPCG